MIGHAEDDGVDVLVVEQFAIVGVGVDLDVAFFELRHFGVQELRVHVADRHHAHAGELAKVLDMFLALLADTYDGYTDVVIGPPDPRPRTGRQDNTAHSSQRSLYKGTTGALIHGHVPPFAQRVS